MDIYIGITVVVLALTVMTFLVWRSRKVIDRLNDVKPKSVREAMRALKDDR